MMSVPFRVIHIIPSIAVDLGGTSNVASYLNAFLLEGDRECSELCVDSDTKKLVWMKVLKSIVLSFLSKERVHVYHFHGVWALAFFVIPLVLIFLKKPFIFSPHGMLEPWCLLQKPFKKRIVMLVGMRFILSKARVLHATSEQEKRSLEALGFTSITVIGNGVYLDGLKDKSCESLSESTKKMFLYLGRLHKKKGLEALLSSWAEAGLTDAILHIVGDGEKAYLKTLEAKIKALQIEDSVSILPSVYGIEKTRAFQKADFFVLPSYSENYGLVVAEAMLSGVPVLVSDCLPWNHLADMKCGWLFSHASPGDLKVKIQEMNDLPPREIKDFSHRARVYAESDLSWSARICAFRRMYEILC